MTGKPKVLFNALTSFRFRDDMLDAQAEARDALGRPAVTTTMAGRPGHALAQPARNPGFAGHR